MSLALIRSDLLTDIANQGEAAERAIEQSVQEFLDDIPGPSLPEQFYSPFELVDRSIRNATKTGKHALIHTLERMLRHLFRKFRSCKLDVVESRRILAILALAKSHRGLCNEQLTMLVFLSIKEPKLFWSKVTPVQDILGKKRSDHVEFMQSLWEHIPRTMRNRIEKLSSITVEIEFETGIKQAVKFWQHLRMKLSTKEKTYRTGLMMLSDREPLVYSENQIRKQSTKPVPRVDFGSVRLHHNTFDTAINAIPSRWQMMRRDLVEI